MFRLLKYAVGGLISLVVFVLVANAIWVQVTGRQVAKRMERIRAAGEPTTWQEYIAKQEGAASGFYTAAIRQELNTMGRELRPVMDSRSYASGNFTDDEIKALEASFAAHPDILRVASNVADHQRWFSSSDAAFPANGIITNQFLDAASAPRGLLRVLRLQMMLQLQKNRHEEAVQTCLDTLRLSRMETGAPSMMSGLVQAAMTGMAIGMTQQVLRDVKTDRLQHKQFEVELAKHRPVEAYRESLRGERLIGVAIQRNNSPWSQSWITRGLQFRSLAKYLDLMDLELQTSVDASSLANPADLKVPANGDTMLLLLIPSIDISRTAALRVECQLRALRALNAIHSNGRKDAEMVDITQLGLPAEATTDPFTGKPLLAKKTAEGWTVYSVGPNGVDDGGKIDPEKGQPLDFGVGPPKKAE